MRDVIDRVERDFFDVFAEHEKIAEFNQQKILTAMQENRLSESHFALTNGYGYDDVGREVVERIYADIFKAETALVRPQIISGTHALCITLFGNLRPNDTLLYVTGSPYNTLHSVIGLKNESGSLADFGIKYRQTDLQADGCFNFPEIKKILTSDTSIKMIGIQRSKGYTWRQSFNIAEISKLIQFIKNIRPDVICMVDNCYGEFVETAEPIEVGADIAVGSLIKNPGGGLAPAGGYIVGKRPYIEKAAERLTAPGLGGGVGPMLGFTTVFLHGLFLAPQTVNGSLHGAILAAAVFQELGYKVLPDPYDTRTDIVQAIELKTAEKVLSFCRGIQKAAPVDSFVTPEFAQMPGYDHDVVMAAGSFVQGASIELSADSPMEEPFVVYMQGGLTRYHAKIGVAFALEEVLKISCIP
ncbi:MAG: methionine gamma-lyase family protein [Turicibacter sp.]|nr:methionine gamma-lyase family protein [Turicibacter sp.]